MHRSHIGVLRCSAVVHGTTTVGHRQATDRRFLGDRVNTANPGETEFTRTPNGPYSAAADLVNASTAAVLAL